jgi:hypothetical protein
VVKRGRVFVVPQLGNDRPSSIAPDSVSSRVKILPRAGLGRTRRGDAQALGASVRCLLVAQSGHSNRAHINRRPSAVYFAELRHQPAVRVTSSSSSSSGTTPLPPHVGHCCSSSVPFSMTPSPLHSGQVFTCASLSRSREPNLPSQRNGPGSPAAWR